MNNNQENLDFEDDGLEWETLSEPKTPRRQFTPAQKAYLERKKDRPSNAEGLMTWRDLYKPLDWEERNVPHDEQEQGRGTGD